MDIVQSSLTSIVQFVSEGSQSVGNFLGSYGWPIVISCSVAYFTYSYLNPRSSRTYRHTGGVNNATYGGHLNGNPLSSHSRRLVAKIGRLFPSHHPHFITDSELETFHRENPEIFNALPARMRSAHNRWPSIMDAATMAKKNDKLLFIYLHNDQADSKYLEETLCTEFVSDLLRENFISWAGVGGTREAYALTRVLQQRTFPFVCVMYIKPSSSNVQMVPLFRCTGIVDPMKLLESLVECIDHREEIIEQKIKDDKAKDMALNYERALKMQQDLEYEHILKQDREAQRLAEEERKHRADENERIRIEEEKRREIKEHFRQWIDDKHAALKQEPEASSPLSMSIAIRTQDGKRLNRRFDSSSLFEQLLDYVDINIIVGSYDENELCHPHHPRKYGLVAFHPRRMYTDRKHGKTTLADLQLNGVMLTVEELAENRTFDGLSRAKLKQVDELDAHMQNEECDEIDQLDLDGLSDTELEALLEEEHDEEDVL